MELVSNLRRLPNDIVLKIWSYSYSPQPCALMEDIRDYGNTLEYMRLYYYEKYQTDELDRIIYDLFNYISFFSFSEDRSYYVDFWRRNIYCRSMSEESINYYINRMENNVGETQIRLLWGMLYPVEREDFIDAIETFVTDDEGDIDEEDYDY